MFKRSMRVMVVGGGLALGLALPGLALADSAGAPAGSGPSNPLPLNAPLSGSLAGDTGGSFSYAQFDYPGDGSIVTLNLTVDNALPLENGAAGFNVYQGGNLLGSSTETSPTSATLALSSSTAGPVLVQVFDYEPGVAVNYTLAPAGLTVAAPAASAPATTAAAATPAGNRVLGSSDSGSLVGDNAGSFRLYSLPYGGNGQNVTISLSVSPSLEVANAAAGFNVYDPMGNLVGSGQQTDTGVVSLTISGDAATTYTIQVFNYDPTTTISYTLTQAAS